MSTSASTRSPEDDKKRQEKDQVVVCSWGCIDETGVRVGVRGRFFGRTEMVRQGGLDGGDALLSLLLLLLDVR